MSGSAPSRPPIVLASQSAVRARMLSAAGVEFAVVNARVDERALRSALNANGASPREMADVLADAKARKIGERRPEAAVVGADQVLDHAGVVFGKPETPEAARSQLRDLRGRTHKLHSAVVLYHEGRPVWRHLAEVRLTMREFDDSYLDGYLGRNWPAASQSVGAYLLEAEGIRLFRAIEGDFFSALGLPLLPLLDYLSQRGFIEA